MAFAERKQFFDYSTQAKNVPIGQNRRRGRPHLTASAIQYQYNDYIAECIYSDTDSESEKPAPKHQKTTKPKKGPSK